MLFRSLLIYNIDPDTLPQNTLSPVNSVINPQLKGPGQGLPAPVNGQRYLLVDDIGTDGGPFSNAWGNLVAHANDIIQYTGSHWVVSFDSQSTQTLQYVSNLTTGVQYKWNGNQWLKSYEGEYKEGLWTLVL